MTVVAGDSGVVITIGHLASTVERDITSLLAGSSSSPERSSVGNELARYGRRYFLIVPPGARVTARPAIITSRVLSSNLRERIPVTEAGVDVTPIGVSAGQHIAEILVRPISVSGVQSMATTWDSLVIEVRFVGGLVHVHADDASFQHSAVAVLNEGYCSLPRHRVIGTASDHDEHRAERQHASVLVTAASAGDTRKVRVASTRDGVARLAAAAVLAVCPEWRGVRVSALRLHLRGKEQRLYIPERHTVLDDSTEILYYGRRPFGDTTWFSPFTRECVMYLTVDSTSAPFRFAQRGVSAGGTVMSTIDVDRHIEEEYDYNQSYFYDEPFDSFFVTETVPGEKWHWASFDRRTPFDTNIPLVPSKRPDDSLRVSILYDAINNIRDAKPDKRVQCFVYGRRVYDETFDSTAERRVQAILAPGDCYGASMNVRAVSLGANTNVPNYSEKQILDFITVKGRVQSYAWNGGIDGSADVPSASSMRVRRLHSPEAVLLDTVNGEACRIPATSGVTFIAGTRSGSVTGSEITRNDSVVVRSPDARVNVRLFPASGYPAETGWSGTSGSPELLAFLRSAPSGACVVMTANETMPFPADLRQWLQSQGSTRATEKGSKGCYGIIFRKDVGVLDEAASDSSVTVGGFIPTPDGRSYEAMVPLRAGLNGITLRSADSIETADLSDVSSASLRSDSSEAEYLVVTHKAFAAQARRLATYRARTGMTVRVVDID
ncbi:MAG: hypothetical protein ACKO9V_08140, partial [Candidatus Kapaibacterium sp.]